MTITTCLILCIGSSTAFSRIGMPGAGSPTSGTADAAISSAAHSADATHMRRIAASPALQVGAVLNPRGGLWGDPSAPEMQDLLRGLARCPRPSAPARHGAPGTHLGCESLPPWTDHGIGRVSGSQPDAS